MLGIGVRKLAIRILRSQVCNTLGVIEGQLCIAEIAMQHRPQRIVVVDDAGGWQAGAHGIEAMPDQR